MVNISFHNTLDISIYAILCYISLSGMAGPVSFDGNGDRSPTFWLVDFKNSSGISRIIGIFSKSVNSGKVDIQEH